LFLSRTFNFVQLLVLGYRLYIQVQNDQLLDLSSSNCVLKPT
jgi:hypothetical protein